MSEHIRNFSIIAHVDHGKSTLADRMLEVTQTVHDRDMHEQMLDGMELEQERGITIKMTPVRMRHEMNDDAYILNLIDTPGHIDFSYEVSRALKAVEGAVLLVDATQGIQAQTYTTLAVAREQDLKIIPAVSKIDADRAETKKVKKEIADLLDCDIEKVKETSGKTGEGVRKLLNAIVDRIPHPSSSHKNKPRSLVFDYDYSNHQGIIMYARIFDGVIDTDSALELVMAEEAFTPKEVGIFGPEPQARETLSAGEIGYVVTGIKKPDVVTVGDTVRLANADTEPFAGYQDPQPVIWASVFPQSGSDFSTLQNALQRLKLQDSALSFEQESSDVLGRGFRCGFLGMLHLEIIVERLRREFDIELTVTAPTVTYSVTTEAGDTKELYAPSRFPPYHVIETIREPTVQARLITPMEYISPIMQLLQDREVQIGDTETAGDDRTIFNIAMPLRVLMRNFFDDLKRVSSGYASFSYEIEDTKRQADVVRMQILVSEEVIPAFSRIVGTSRLQEEARSAVDKLEDLLPRQLYKQKVQARAQGDIVASATVPAIKQDAAADLYGGDISRKKKLRERQKEGRKEMRERAAAEIPQEVFVKMVRTD